MNFNELQEIYKTISEYGQTMSTKLDYLRNMVVEKNDIKTKIRNLIDNNSINNSSQFDEIIQMSGDDFTQYDQDMDISS